jgi:hypothetical protein
MDLDELKNTWMVLDERLKKNEMLNRQIVQEMLYKKSNKSLNWLIGADLISAIITLLAIPLWIGFYNKSPFQNIYSLKIISVFLIVMSIFSVIWICYKLIKYLMKIDFSISVKDNMYFVNKYSILIKKEKIISYFIVIPVLFLLSIWFYYELKVNLSFWVFLGTVFISATIIVYWASKKIYDANIQSIKKSLEELEELKEE